jgi:hypothetical protein
MKISQIYEKYKIIPQLQNHMLRVAGVASIICNHLTKPVDKNLVISACLLHDMGNIVKFRLERYPEFLKPKGLKFWQNIQNDFIRKYSKDDYKTTYKILNELQINPLTLKLIKSIEFKKAPLNSKLTTSLESKVCHYSDARVAPTGVVTLNGRFQELKERFIKNRGINEKGFNKITSSMKLIEEQIFYVCKIKPGDITDRKVMPQMLKLQNFDIETK